MFLRRYHMRAGATTTAGGVVIASCDWYTVNGVPLAREGDPVDCPACGRQGVIKCVAPRLADSFEDKEYALSEDLCICGCRPPSKLIADQDFHYQEFLFVDEAGAKPADDRRTENAANPTQPDVDSHSRAVLRSVRFVDRHTRSPWLNRSYRITLIGGKVIQGTTDSQGITDLLDQDERNSLSAT